MGLNATVALLLLFFTDLIFLQCFAAGKQTIWKWER